MFTPAIETYLAQTVIPLRLGCTTPSGWPMVVSLWYLYADGRFYCATSAHAKTVSYLQADARCAFEVAADTPPYCGVRGQATAVIEPARGDEILEKLLHRYLGGLDNELARTLLARDVAEVAICLTPTTQHTWNFSSRMANLEISDPQKPCP